LSNLKDAGAWFTLPQGAKNHMDRDRIFSRLWLFGMRLGVHSFWSAGNTIEEMKRAFERQRDEGQGMCV